MLSAGRGELLYYAYIMNRQTTQGCELCALPGGEICWEDARCRVVLVTGRDGADYPGTCRVIWRSHVAEMTDLNHADRERLMQVVYATESALRQLCQPHKINLASLGNLVPHLHWHVIPRYVDDAHFPAPIWAQAARPAAPGHPPPALGELQQTLSKLLSGVTVPGA